MKLYANAKVIVAGEHSVLQGHPALVIPIVKKQLYGNYVANKKFLAICNNNQVENSTDLWHEFLVNASKTAECVLSGEWFLNIDIPIGSGLGFSSALSVLTAKWFARLGHIKNSDIFKFAHTLEQPIHGISSGCDIAGAMHKSPILFSMPNNIFKLNSTWKPALAWTNTSSKSSTKDQIKKVNASLCYETIENMSQATKNAAIAWQNESIAELANAINMAGDSFHSWGLVTKEMADKMAEFKKLGVLACKPTGAGGGGCILSLWDKKNQLQELNWIH